MFLIGFCYPHDWLHDGLVTTLTRLKKMGYDGVEFWEQTVKVLTPDQLADALATSGLACAQLCPYFNFVSGQAQWDETMRIGERYVALSAHLGRPLIRVFTGPSWGPGVVGAQDATPAQWDAAIAGLQRICDMAAPHGIRLALECHTGSLMEDSPSSLRLIHGVDRENLGVNLQLPLSSGHEPVEVSLRELGRYTWHMHAHNCSALINGQQLPLGEGIMNYADILTQLYADGFRGYVSIEHPSYEGTRDPWVVAEHEAAYLKRLRADLSKRL